MHPEVAEESEMDWNSQVERELCATEHRKVDKEFF